MKVRKKPIEVFSQWAESGRDQGMEKNHREAVDAMLAYALDKPAPFSFIDAGCGNGWVVRQVSQNPACQSAIGVDGSQKMIAKAQTMDPQNSYVATDLLQWSPKETVSLVHSMEVFYYLQNPQEIITHIYKNWLAPGGRLIIGLDFYYENKVSHTWPEDCGISIMTLLPKSDWLAFFDQAGFQNTLSWQVGAKQDWASYCLNIISKIVSISNREA